MNKIKENIIEENKLYSNFLIRKKMGFLSKKLSFSEIKKIALKIGFLEAEIVGLKHNIKYFKTFIK